ncbi:MAG: type II secretion system minor pseudopilin GspI [Kordiimonadaceae bacterium]|nr:type II secretion system minor pseudopilin GspI [Kordiimonadaceae bacterium]MBO6568089.1 type II secretion system minor pseudopilin GspI [Kordiimonadaceae bacterium]MBO6964181.1 type II secretion system minor pseudopilin GspI [Kordiimonadaceae bacterium]
MKTKPSRFCQILKSDGGFSLIELLVAVSILALAAVSLLESQTQAISITSQLEQRSLASIVAENRLNLALGLIDEPAPGTRSGSENQMGMDFRWQETVRPAPGGDLTIIEVTVSTNDRQPRQLARLVGFRKVP